MNIDEKIEDLRKEFENKIKELKEEYELEKNVKWIPKFGKNYYYVDPALGCHYSKFVSTVFDNDILKYGKIFKTEEQAQEYADYLKARKKFSYEFSKEEWENNRIYKYYIYYDFKSKIFYVDYINYCGRIGTTYFKTYEKAQEFLDRYEKQILKFEFDIEEKNNE